MRHVVLGLVLVAGQPDGGPRPDEIATYYLTEDIDGGESAQFRELESWARRGGAKEIAIIIDSAGGSATEAMALFRAVKGAGLPTRCEVRGMAASGAFLVLQACDKRHAALGSRLGTHRVRALLKQPIVTVEQARVIANDLEAASNAMDALIAARMGIPLAKYREKTANGADWMMTTAEALANRAVDAVVRP